MMKQRINRWLGAIRRQFSLSLDLDSRREIWRLNEELDELRGQLTRQSVEFNALLHEATRALHGDLMTTRRVFARRDGHEMPVVNEGPPRVKEEVSLDQAYRRLERLAPSAFSVWRSLVDVNADAYEGFPTDSCSMQGHFGATLFQGFLAPYLRGRVLDIGCGPQPLPWYLAGHPPQLIYGVDPLANPGHHEFECYQGLAEFLPWADGQFDTVVAATSLDHVLLLDQSLREIHRMLGPSGHFVVWVGFIDGSPRYDPYRRSIKPIDAYHLFHFDREWFFDEISGLFTVDECLELDRGQSTGSVFLALKPRAVHGRSLQKEHSLVNGR